MKLNKIIYASSELNLDVPILPNWREWEVEQLILNRYFDKDTGECIRSTIGADDYRESFIAGYNHNKNKYNISYKKTLNMKCVKRWYYLLFERGSCYKATLEDRMKHKWGIVEYGDKYLGNDWWLRPRNIK